MATAHTIAEAHLPAWEAVWAVLQPLVTVEVEQAARQFRVDRRTLLRLVLLHLPRFTETELSSHADVREEVTRLAKSVAQRQSRFRDWIERPHIKSLRREQVWLGDPSRGIVRAIHETFHYLGSAREGRHFGLYHSSAKADLPVSLATVSVLDVKHLLGRLSPALQAGEAWLLSRVFTFDWAPRNSVSALLGLMCRELKRLHPGSTVLFTYVNPNLRFTAASYKASNWREAGKQPITYRYLNGRYITAREALQLPKGAGDVTYSHYLLEPLNIYRYNFVNR